jgi:hypothetical protein
METGPSEFLQQLHGALAARATWLESRQVPILKESLRTYRSLLEGIYAILVKKALIREDPYALEGRVRDITVPPDDPIPDGAETEDASLRISAYRKQMDFVVNDLRLGVDLVDLDGLKRISALLGYIDWTDMGASSFSPITRALFRLMGTIRLGTDVISARMLADSQAQIVESLSAARMRLAELESWHRERWKAEVREKVLPRVPAQPPTGVEDRVEETAAVKRVFDQKLPNTVWRSDLVTEILAEDRPDDAGARKSRILASLVVPQASVARTEVLVDHRPRLLEAIRGLCRVNDELARGEAVLLANELDLEKHGLSVLQRIRRWFRRGRGKVDDRYYDIDLKDPAASETRRVSLSFLGFIADLREMQGVLTELAAESSAASRRLAELGEKQLGDFLDWQLRQLRQFHRKMEALNSLFQVRAINERRIAARGIKLELLAIENGIARADAVRQEWGPPRPSIEPAVEGELKA